MLKRNEMWEDSLHRPPGAKGVDLRSNAIQVEIFTKIEEKKGITQPTGKMRIPLRRKTKTSPLFWAWAIFQSNNQTRRPTAMLPPNGRCIRLAAPDKLITGGLPKNEWQTGCRLLKGLFFELCSVGQVEEFVVKVLERKTLCRAKTCSKV